MILLGQLSILALRYYFGNIDYETLKRKAKICAYTCSGRMIGGTIGLLLGSLIG